MSRDSVAIVESTHAQSLAAVRARFAELREADVQLEKSSKRAGDAARRLEAAGERVKVLRVELGRALLVARPAWPSAGPRAKGWGEFLAAEGINERSARDWMELAREIGDLDISAPGAEIPSRRDVDAARSVRDLEDDATERVGEPENEPGAVEIISPGDALDLRLGDWRIALADVGVVDAIICDPPYGKRTHAAATTRDDGVDPEGLTPTYPPWTDEDVDAFVSAWSPRCRGWMVALTSHDLIPAWESAYAAADRFSFAPVACLISGMSVRRRGDGPSSWAVYAMVARPRNLSTWGTVQGGYPGPREDGAHSGRGKPRWLMDAIVRDYSRAGDLVCDPLAGWGVTLTSALNMGRRGVGAEIDETARRDAIIRWREGSWRGDNLSRMYGTKAEPVAA